MTGSRPRESRWWLVLTLSLASVVAGLFTLSTELARERHETYIQACSLAGQVVTDDALDQAMDAGTRAATVRDAERQLRRCWEM